MYISERLKNSGSIKVDIFSDVLNGKYTSEIIMDSKFVSQETFILNLDKSFTEVEIVEKVAFLNIVPNQIFRNKDNTYSVLFVTDIFRDDINAKRFYDTLVLIYGKNRVSGKNSSLKTINGERVFNNNIKDKNIIIKVGIFKTFLDNNQPRRASFPEKEENIYLGTLKKKFITDTENDKIFKIYREFLKSSINFDEYIGIASNLYFRQGGILFFTKTCKENNFEYGDALMKYLKTMDIQEPTKLRNFSPYIEDWVYDTMNEGYNTRMIKNSKAIKRELICAEIMRQEMASDFDYVLNEAEDGVYLMKYFVGMGKTRLLEHLRNVTIACYTHEGIDELFERRRNCENAVLTNRTPRLPEFSEALLRRVKYLYSIGCSDEARKLILDVSQDRKNKYSYADVGLAMKFVKIKNDKETALLTTHQGALHMKPIHDTLIIDEDIMKTLIVSKKVKISDIYAMLQNLEGKQKTIFQNAIEVLENLSCDVAQKTPKFVSLDLKNLLEVAILGDVSSDVINLFKSTVIYKNPCNKNEIYYMVKEDLPKYKKIIILSATASNLLYETVFEGHNLKIIDKTNVKLKANITQYTYHSLSNSNLKNKIEEVSDFVGDRLCITHRKNRNKFQNPAPVYYGNTSGQDGLNGVKNLIVVGTYRIPSFYYFMLAETLDIEYKAQNLGYKEIENEHITQQFYTFENEWMRRIEVDTTMAETMQGIGRARPIDNECDIIVLNNLVLPCASEIITENYLLED